MTQRFLDFSYRGHCWYTNSGDRLSVLLQCSLKKLSRCVVLLCVAAVDTCILWWDCFCVETWWGDWWCQREQRESIHSSRWKLRKANTGKQLSKHLRDWLSEVLSEGRLGLWWAFFKKVNLFLSDLEIWAKSPQWSTARAAAQTVIDGDFHVHMICSTCWCFYLFKEGFWSLDQQSKAPKGQRQRGPYKTVTIKFCHTGSTESLFNNHPGNVHGCHSFPPPWKSFYYNQTLNSWTLHLGNYLCQ